MFLRRLWALRRRFCSRPVLLLGVALCLFYQTLMVARDKFKTSPIACNGRNKSTMTIDEKFNKALLKKPERLISALLALQNKNQAQRSERAVVLSGQHVGTVTEVQLYQRVLKSLGYHVSVSRYAETSSALRGASQWNILIALRGSEKSCLRRVVGTSHLRLHQRVNMIPGLVVAFAEPAGLCRLQTDGKLAGLTLPISPSACRSPSGGGNDDAKDDWNLPISPPSSPDDSGFVATVKVYVLVTSATPLTAFLHRTCLAKTDLNRSGYTTELHAFLQQYLDSYTSQQALGHVKEVTTDILLAAALTTEKAGPRCRLCFQLLTFTLHFNNSIRPVVFKVQTDLLFDGLEDPALDGQVAKEAILEEALRFLLPVPPLKPYATFDPSTGDKYGGCEGTGDLRLPRDELLILLQFLEQMRRRGSFQLLYPAAPREPSAVQQLFSETFREAEDSGKEYSLPLLLDLVRSFYEERRSNQSDGSCDLEDPGLVFPDPQHKGERCVDPHLRQLYTAPALVLTPPFNPRVKAYRADVPFDLVTVRLRPEPVSPACHVHLDEQRGPRTANYPVGLGNSRISILVTDESGDEPLTMAIYTLRIFRESRPSLPMFDEHVMCGFVQDCGLVVRPDQPCGLEPLPGRSSLGEAQASSRPCSSGDVPGRWVVPCLSCSDDRTCDWRGVAWEPDGCRHLLPTRLQLQECMMDRKVLFIGDSTNRGMMYLLMERVNATLEDWGKAHDTLVYRNVNKGRTHVSYSYYPQFWLETQHRPTFQQALRQLLQRSRPLKNSPQTVLVVGGVQWLNAQHLRIIREVLEREELQDITVVVKSLGMGFHLPVDGIRSLTQGGVQQLYNVNKDILTSAKHYGYEVIDTFSITMGRYKEFLQGRCACHFHEVERMVFSEVPLHRKMKILRQGRGNETGPNGTGFRTETIPQDEEPWASSSSPSPSPSSSSLYHVRGAVNQVYSEILLSRLCVADAGNTTRHH